MLNFMYKYRTFDSRPQRKVLLVLDYAIILVQKEKFGCKLGSNCKPINRIVNTDFYCSCTQTKKYY